MNIDNKKTESQLTSSTPYTRELTKSLKIDKETVELELLSSSVISESITEENRKESKLEVNVYKERKTSKIIIGLDHYLVTDQEVLISLESYKKLEATLKKLGL